MRIATTLRYVGYVLLLAIAEPLWIQPFSYDASFVESPRFPRWIVAFAAFVLAFHMGASAPVAARRRRVGALLVMASAILVMEGLLACEFGALALCIVASQAAIVFSPGQVATFIAFETAALGYLLMRSVGWGRATSHLAGLLAAECFAAVAVYLARRSADDAAYQTETARELGQANAELRATQQLLAHSSRAEERTRISRELHDVLGHDLTALRLQLEIAMHVGPDRSSSYVAKAQEVSGRLLENVRGVVATMPASTALNLESALRELIRGVPALAVHLALDDDLQVHDAARAQCIVRCVQEIITNALKHSRASNLWITIALVDGAITLDARDDGKGATEVRPGQGLSGMRARLEELGGRLGVATEPSRAFAVRAWLPAK